MLEIFKKNAVVRYAVVFFLGITLAYFSLPRKTTIKEVKVIQYVKIASKSHSVATTKSGVTTVVTDISSISDSTTKADSYEKTETNKRIGTIEIGAMFDRRVYFHANTTVIGSVIVGVHAEYQPETHKTMTGVGLGLAF